MFVRAFEPDDEYDRTYASDGVSRYGAYLQNYAHWFDEDCKPSTHAERFAAAAWRIAQIPVMAPAYVRRHGRVRTTFIDWDDRGNAAVRVDIAVSSAPEAVCLAYPWRRWTRDELGRWLEPESYNQPGAVTVLQVAMPLADMPLPEPRYELWAPDTTVAKQAVQVICGAVNIALTRVLAYDPLTEVDQCAPARRGHSWSPRRGRAEPRALTASSWTGSTRPRSRPGCVGCCAPTARSVASASPRR